MRLVSAVLLYTLVALAGCTGGAPKNDSNAPATTVADSAKSDPESKLDAKGTRYLVASLAAYYKLKDALVATNAPQADIAAALLVSNTDSLWDPILFSGMESVSQKLFVHLASIKASVRDLTGMMDESCEKKRIHFAAISSDFYQVITLCGLRNVTIYRQYCPGAFNDKGAYWLSKDKEIRNPYFGNKMLEYGEVAETIH
ncbi:MAG: DUF3347 domain-containing protein [Flavipsychrobacter sp.]|nr:DUF3347 domain-containing protein [Flavipsychrobacter sp.]